MRKEVARQVRAEAFQLHAHVDKHALASVPHRVVGLVMALRRVPSDADDRRKRLALAAVDHHLLDDPRHLALGHARAEPGGRRAQLDPIAPAAPSAPAVAVGEAVLYQIEGNRQ